METVLINYIAPPGVPFAYPITPRTPLKEEYYRTLYGTVTVDSWASGQVTADQRTRMITDYVNQLVIASVGRNLALMLKPGESLGIVVPSHVAELIAEAYRRNVATEPPKQDCKPGEQAA